MTRPSNRIAIVCIPAAMFFLFAAGCSGGNKSNSATAGNNSSNDEPTVYPDPEGDIPTALAPSGLPAPAPDPPSPGQIAAATGTWNPKLMSEINALIAREIDGDPSQAEIDALDLLYSETPTPPDPGQI